MLTQVAFEYWFGNGAERPLCQFPFSVEEMKDRHGLNFESRISQLWQSVQAIVEAEGMTFMLTAVPDAAPPLSLVEATVRGDVRNPQIALEALCRASDIPVDQLAWVAPDLSCAQWSLWRLDDNGNRSRMLYFRDKSMAEAAASAYERKGHKQSYYVEHEP